MSRNFAVQSNFDKRDSLKRERGLTSGKFPVHFDSSHRQNVQRLAESSGKREIYACFFPLPLIEVRL
jgi:hypothetical protein